MPPASAGLAVQLRFPLARWGVGPKVVVLGWWFGRIPHDRLGCLAWQVLLPNGDRVSAMIKEC